MSCEEMRELFSASLESSLDAALTLKLESHIQMCSACRTELDGLRLVWDKLDVLETVEPPKLLHGEIMERIDAERESVQRPGLLVRLRQMFPSPRALAAAAAFAFVLLAGYSLHYTQQATLGPIHFPVVQSQPNHFTPASITSIKQNALHQHLWEITIKAADSEPGMLSCTIESPSAAVSPSQVNIQLKPGETRHVQFYLAGSGTVANLTVVSRYQNLNGENTSQIGLSQ